MAFEGLHFDVGMNAADFNQGVKQMKGQVQTFDDSLKKVGRTIAGVFAGVSVVATLKKSIELWGKQETAVKKLSIAANRFTRDSTKTVSTVQKLASELQHLTGMGDEAIISVAALGLNLGIAEEKIGKATEAAALLAQVTDMSLESAMKNMAKTQAGLTGELGEMLPFLRELTTEELKNGAAIDMIIEKYAGFAEQLSQTSEVGIKRFWSALGDIGEKLGQSFTPMILKAADAMENLSSKIEKPVDMITIMKNMIKNTYDNMSLVGKGITTLIGAFIGLKVAGKAWTLLSSIVAKGGGIMVGIFKTIFSWPFMILFGLYTLRVAWEHNWFGMRDAVVKVWDKIKPIWESMRDFFSDLEMNDVTDTLTAGFDVLWEGLNWTGEKITITYNFVKDWVLEQIGLTAEKAKEIYDMSIDIAEVTANVLWNAFQWAKEKAVLTLDAVTKWVKDQIEIAEDAKDMVIDIARVTAQVAWEGYEWLKEKVVITADNIKDWVIDKSGLVKDEVIDISIKVGKVVGTLATDAFEWAEDSLKSLEIEKITFDDVKAATVEIGKLTWESIKWIGNAFSDATDSLADLVRTELFEETGDDNDVLDLKDLKLFIDAAGEIAKMTWEGIKFAAGAAQKGIDNLKNKIKEQLGFEDSANVTWADLTIKALGNIKDLVWSGLTWFTEGPVHSFANWVRDKLGIENKEIEANLGDDLRVIFTGAFKGGAWLTGWAIDAMKALSDTLTSMTDVVAKKLRGAELSKEDKELYNAAETLGKNIGEIIVRGIQLSFQFMDFIKEGVQTVTEQMTENKALAGIAGAAIPIYFSFKWADNAFLGEDGLGIGMPLVAALAGVKGLARLASGMLAVSLTVQLADKVMTSEDLGRDIANVVIAGGLAAGLGVMTGSPLTGLLAFQVMLYIVPKFTENLEEMWKDAAEKMKWGFRERIVLPGESQAEFALPPEKVMPFIDEYLENTENRLGQLSLLMESWNLADMPDKQQVQNAGIFAERAANIVKSIAEVSPELESLDPESDAYQFYTELYKYTDSIEGITKALQNADTTLNEKIKLIEQLYTLETPEYTPTGHQSGGYISGPGTKTSDSIPALLSNGEYVINAEATEKTKPLLDLINAGKITFQKFAKGGIAGIKNLIKGYQGGGEVVEVDAGTHNIKVDVEVSLASLLGSPGMTVEQMAKDFVETVGLDWETGMDVLINFIENIGEKLGLDVSGPLEELEELQSEFDELKKETQETTSILDQFKQALADSSELFRTKELEDGSLQLVSIFSDMGNVVSQFGMELFNSLMNVEAINKLLNPISTIISGMMVILEPMLNLLMPIADLLSSIGTWMATLLTVFQPMIKIFSRGAAILSWFFDQWTLLVDKLFRWLDSIPGVGRFFDPILSEEERQKKQMTIEERLEQYDIPQSTANTTFSAGSTQEITNNYYFEFKDNQILTEDDESVRRFADAIYQNLRDRGVEFEVG